MTQILPPADPALAQTALQVLRALCKGNGVKTESVTVTSFKGYTHTIPASTFLEMKPLTRDKILPGRQVSGKLCNTQADAQRAIDQVIIAALQDASARRQMTELLLKRADKGFALPNGTTLSVDFLTQDFCWHENCRHCSGQGKSACPRCSGQMREQCNQCHGRTMVPCTLCRGSGHVTGQGGKPQPCSRCHGQRQMPCQMCQRTGKIPCRQCRGQGFGQCTSCSGTGCFTHVLHMTPQMATHFEYDRTITPPDILTLLDQNALALMQGGYIKVASSPAQTEPHILAVSYNITFPFGDIVFAVGKRELTGKLFGYKTRLLNIPPFLEKLLTPAMRDLEHAAAGRGSVAGKIRKATRYRAAGIALLGAGTQTVRATTDVLMKKFPIGLSRGAAEKMAKLSDAAVAHITRKPRYAGLVIGLVLVAALYAFYYLGTGRAILAGYIPDPKFDMVIDLAIILIGGTLTTLCIRLAGMNAMRTALGHLVQGKDRKKLIPKARGSGWWGYAGGLALYLIMIELTIHTGTTTPGWYQSLRTMVGL